MQNLGRAFVVLVALSSSALADTTPQSLPFTQDWTNTAGAITTADNWSGVPGIIGYKGATLTTTTGVDPQTVTADDTQSNVIINQTMPNTATTGGVAEFEIADPVVALNGSGGARGPNLVITFITTGVTGVHVAYSLRDIDGSTDNSIQPVALQYRVGTTGTWTNVAAGFVADASSGPSLATLVSPVSVTLPAAADNQPVVQVRIITTDAVGNDEWIGIDDINISGTPTPPTGVGMSSPATAVRGAAVTLSAAITLGTFPASTGVTVTCDLTSLGGSATQALFDDGTNGDGLGGDNIFTFATTVPTDATFGGRTFPCTVADTQTRSSNFNINFSVIAVCGDGVIEGAETCDDGQSTPADGDGCSATCTTEPGWACTGAPSTCTDIDECATNTDDCSPEATCNNATGGFSCQCLAGFTGNGHGANGCVDIDECAMNLDNCDANAACINAAGGFACQCNSGFTGNGVTCTDIDECAGTNDCVATATCGNTTGSYTCACPMGFGGDGRTTGTGCMDLDECTLNTDNCDANAMCTNTVGAFTCACNGGFTGNGVTCTDIDECAANTDDCIATATCNNTSGAYTCACPTGYGGDGKTSGTGCSDVDECTANTDNCDTHATCTNTTGSFTCACNTGFTGNGVTCTDVDECAGGTDNCDANANCTNTAGSFTCQCAAGYSGDGTTCSPNCGDGVIHTPEDCDDNNMTDGDGCTKNCVVEDGFNCTGTPSTCTSICGDGLKVAGEECDDGNTAADDGCGALCKVEDGWTCTGTPSSCEPPPDGGCCSSSTHPGSVALLALFVMVGLRRRKRS